MKSKQLDFDAIPVGTYLNTGRVAQKSLRLNRFCYELRERAKQDAFKADPEATMERYKLSETDRELIRQNDWLSLVRGGANIFVLLRLTHLRGFNVATTGAQMRGEQAPPQRTVHHMNKGN